jgi:hypothetical protein
MSNNIEILVQGSAKAGPAEDQYTVLEAHKAVVDDVLYVYTPEEVVSGDDARAYGLVGTAAKKSKSGGDGGDGGEGGGEPASLEERISAVGSHADANALADELGVEGFEAKKPSLDEKKEQLAAAAAAKAVNPGE